MNALFCRRGLGIMFIASILVTSLTYLVQLATPITNAFVPMFMQYNIISTTASNTASSATLCGYPFAFVLTSANVTLFSPFAFVLDWIIFLAIVIFALWLILQTRSGKDLIQPEKTMLRQIRKL